MGFSTMLKMLTDHPYGASFAIEHNHEVIYRSDATTAKTTAFIKDFFTNTAEHKLLEDFHAANSKKSFPAEALVVLLDFTSSISFEEQSKKNNASQHSSSNQKVPARIFLGSAAAADYTLTATGQIALGALAKSAVKPINPSVIDNGSLMVKVNSDGTITTSKGPETFAEGIQQSNESATAVAVSGSASAASVPQTNPAGGKPMAPQTLAQILDQRLDDFKRTMAQKQKF